MCNMNNEPTNKTNVPTFNLPLNFYRPGKLLTITTVTYGLLFFFSGLKDLNSHNILEPLFWIILGLCFIFWFGYYFLFPKTGSDDQNVISQPSLIIDEIKSLNDNPPVVTPNEILNSPYSKPIIILILVFSIVVGLMSFKKDWEINHHYVDTSCKVIDKRLLNDQQSLQNQKNNSSNTYQTFIHVQYQITYLEYNKWISPSNGSTTSLSSEQKTFDQYQIGQEYSCWYNPNNYSEVVLSRGYHMFNILLNLAMIVILVYVLIR